MKYNWDINQIINSNLELNNKEIIIGEDINNLTNTDSSTFDYAKINPFLYSLIYYINKHAIIKNIPNLYEYITYLYSIIDPLSIKSLVFESYSSINENFLINYIRDFFNYLNDNDLLTIINDITNPDNHLLRLDYDAQDKQVTNYVKGRVFKDMNNNLVLGSYYIRRDMLDIPIFTHEIGHMTSGLLFGNTINHNFYDLLRETEAYYFELLSSYYLNDLYHIEDTTNAFRQYRLFHIESDIYNVLIQDAIAKHPLRRIDSINNAIKNYGIQIKKEEIDLLLINDTVTVLGRILSYLIALELVNITIENKKEGIDLFKRLFTDSEEDIEKLLNKYNVDITNPNNICKEMRLKINYKV